MQEDKGVLGWLRRLFGRPSAARALSAEEQKAVDEFCRHLGVRINRPELLRLALTHRSYLHAAGATGPRESNERLEFLGDSVLGVVSSEWLYRNRPDEHEGLLTKTKSLLVSKAILSRRALAMGLGRFVLLSHSEVESGGRQRLSILADAFEAVIGAIYLDQGLDAARQFIQTWLLNEANDIVADKRHTNYKSLLQEYVQSAFHTHPVYRIRHEAGPDHLKQFTVEVTVGSRTLGEGRGRNKKEAEQSAARDALERVATEAAARREGGRRRGGRSESAGPATRAVEPRTAEPRAISAAPPERERRERDRERERPRGRREEEAVAEREPRVSASAGEREERRGRRRTRSGERPPRGGLERAAAPPREEREPERGREASREVPREVAREAPMPREPRARSLPDWEAPAIPREPRSEERRVEERRPEERRPEPRRSEERSRAAVRVREESEPRLRPEPSPPPPPTTEAVEPAQASASPRPEPVFGRKGKPATRGLRGLPGANAPPPATGEARGPVAEVPVATPARHGPIGGADELLSAPLPKPNVKILEDTGSGPPGAPADRYRVVDSSQMVLPPGAPRREDDEEPAAP